MTRIASTVSSVIGAAMLCTVGSTSVAAPPAPAPNPLVGAWHLIEIDEEANGKVVRHRDLTGSLIYTANGRLSVQVMYPDATVSNAYAKAGYEASFGRYTLDLKRRRVTHHVEAANARQLVGTDQPRSFRIEGHQMTIRSVDPAEHWSVVWEQF
jgi:hypothetical protein